MRPIRAFAFDLDETLVNCEAHHVHATKAMLENLGVSPREVEHVFLDITGSRTRDIIAAFRDAAGVPHTTDELLALRHCAFLEALDAHGALLLPGAKALLAECHAIGPIALVTSGHRQDALATAEAADILPFFHTLITGEDVEEPKPAPEPYRIAASRMNVRADEVLAFEDSSRGVAAARAAGCKVVAVPNAPNTLPEHVEGQADLVLGSLEEALPLAELLARLS